MVIHNAIEEINKPARGDGLEQPEYQPGVE
jgi:hypothetical protein